MQNGLKEIDKYLINKIKSDFLEKMLLDRKEHMITGLEVRILNEFCAFLWDNLEKEEDNG